MQTDWRDPIETRIGNGAADSAGGRQMADLIQAYDWSSTPMGAMADWPMSVRTTVALTLRSPVPIVTLWGEQGTMIYNDAYSQFALGRHPKLLGSPVREGWPEVADFNDNVLRVCLAGGSLSYRDQNLVLYRSGAAEQVWLNLDYSAVIGEDGSPVGVIAIVFETSEAVRAARRLKDSEARLQFLFKLGEETAKSTDADTVLDITTQMVGQYLKVTSCAYADMDPDQDGFTIRGDWAAPGAQHIVGHYSLAAFGKLAVSKLRTGEPLVINDNRKELAPEEAAAFQNIGISATICMPLVKEGRLTALMAIHHKQPHVWSEDELALISEVTERSWAHIERVRSEAEVKAGEQRFREELARQVTQRTAALQQSEKNIRTVFETSFMHQGLLTKDGKLVYVNATALAGIDARLEDVIGQDYWNTPWFAGTPGMPAKVRAAIKQAAAGESTEITTSLNLPSGPRDFEFSLRPAFDENDQVVALVPEAIEITARLRAEEALLQAQKVEAIGSLTGGIAHDFNNLLMAILSSLELLRKRLPDDPGLLRLVETAVEGANRGRSLTSRMLTFARRQELKSQHINVVELVSGILELLERSLGPSIAIKTEFSAGPAIIVADANQLEAALLNLAVNARDAMDGNGALTIATRKQVLETEYEGLRAGSYLCLSVADSGTGMSPEVLRRATEPFFTTKGVGKGTGLGLSMVQGLAQQSGGALRLSSTPGQGTIAEIWLPLARAQRATKEQKLVKDTPVAATERKSLNVLAVDDDALILMNVEAMLEDLGHRVVSAASGQRALDCLEQSDFDLMITDHAMPQMTGAQLIAAVRSRYPTLPVILATGYAELPNGIGADITRLGKPYSMADLAKAVTTATQLMPHSGKVAVPGAKA